MLYESDNKTRTRESVIYARVSSKEQEETGYSLPAQEKFLREYADRNELAVDKVFSVSESASGRVQRKIFNEMMNYVKRNRISTIIVETTDRLTRNFADVPAIDNWILGDESRQIHLAKEGCILNRNSRSHELFMWRVKVATAEYYILQLSENVKKGMKEKLAQGWLPTKPPLGYKTIGEKGHKVHVVDEEKAPLIKKMFEFYATREYSLARLVGVMYQEGLRTRSGVKVVKSRMADLLGDPFYAGTIRYNNTLHSGSHEPLVSRELFEGVQRALRGKTSPRLQKHSPLFRSMIRCASCNGLVTWEIQKGHWYGHCNGYRGCVVRKYVRQEKVEEQLLPYIDKITVRSTRLAEWIKKALKEGHRDEIAYNSSAREELTKRYEILQRRIERLYDDKMDGKIAEDFYQRKFEQYAAEKEEALRGLEKHDTASTHYHELGTEIVDLACRAKEIYLADNCTIEDRRTLLSLVFSNLTLQGDKINVSYTKAFETLAQSAPAWNATFEPQETRTNKTKTEACTPVSALLLPGWDEFRTIRWEELFEDPEFTLKQIKQLLNPRVQDSKLAA